MSLRTLSISPILGSLLSMKTVDEVPSQEATGVGVLGVGADEDPSSVTVRLSAHSLGPH